MSLCSHRWCLQVSGGRTATYVGGGDCRHLDMPCPVHIQQIPRGVSTTFQKDDPSRIRTHSLRFTSDDPAVVMAEQRCEDRWSPAKVAPFPGPCTPQTNISQRGATASRVTWVFSKGVGFKTTELSTPAHGLQRGNLLGSLSL